jgi:transcriptional regulator with XRE-family HTH domain
MRNRQTSLLRIVADNVAGVRQLRGLDQTQLARLAKVPCGAVRQAERGDPSLRIHHLLKISQALGVGLAQLFQEST